MSDLSPEIRALIESSGGEISDVPAVSDAQARHRASLGHQPKESVYEGPNSIIPDAFANVREPRAYLKHENHVHRLIIMLASAGNNIKEIAETVEMTPAHVSTVLRQPWAIQRMTSEMRQMRENVRIVLEAAVQGALLTVIDVQQNGVKEENRLKAADSILDRFMGKSIQPVAVNPKDLSNLTDQQLAEIANSGITSSRVITPAT